MSCVFVFRLMLFISPNLFSYDEHVADESFSAVIHQTVRMSSVTVQEPCCCSVLCLTAGSQVGLKSLKRHSKMAKLIRAELWELPFVNCRVFHYHWMLICCWHNSYACDPNPPADTNERNVDGCSKSGRALYWHIKCFLEITIIFDRNDCFDLVNS